MTHWDSILVALATLWAVKFTSIGYSWWHRMSKNAEMGFSVTSALFHERATNIPAECVCFNTPFVLRWEIFFRNFLWTRAQPAAESNYLKQKEHRRRSAPRQLNFQPRLRAKDAARCCRALVLWCDDFFALHRANYIRRITRMCTCECASSDTAISHYRLCTFPSKNGGAITWRDLEMSANYTSC